MTIEVRVVVMLALNIAMTTKPTKTQTNVNKRAENDFGVRSPYLEKGETEGILAT